MLRNKPNKSVDQLFLGVGVNKSVMLSRTRHHFFIVPYVFVACVVLMLCALVYWYLTQPRAVLVSHLPHTTQWYVSVPLPKQETFMQRMLFWKEPTTRDITVRALASQLSFMQIAGRTLQESVLPYSSGRYEMAQLNDTDVVFATTMPHYTEWIASLDIPKGTEEGTLPEVSGWITLHTPTHAWVWKKVGDHVYIANSPEALASITQKRSTTLETVLDAPKHTQATLYIASKNVLQDSGNAIAQLFGSNTTYPISIFAVHKGKNEIRLLTHTGLEVPQTYSGTRPVLQTLVHLSDATYGLYSKQAGKSYARWQTYLSSADLNRNLRIQSLSEQLHGLYAFSIREPIFELPSAVFMYADAAKDRTEYQWVYLIDDVSNNVATSSIETFETIGSTLFAQRYPEQQRVLLPDGTTMIENIADTSSVVWEQGTIELAGTTIAVSQLFDTEGNLFMLVGRVSGLGTFMSNTMERIEHIVSQFQEYVLYDSSDTVCDTSHESLFEFQMSGKVLASTLGDTSVVENIFVYESVTGETEACVALQK